MPIAVDPRRAPGGEDRRPERRPVDRPAAPNRERRIAHRGKHGRHGVRVVPVQRHHRDVEHERDLVRDCREQVSGGGAASDERRDPLQRCLLLGQPAEAVAILAVGDRDSASTGGSSANEGRQATEDAWLNDAGIAGHREPHATSSCALSKLQCAGWCHPAFGHQLTQAPATIVAAGTTWRRSSIGARVRVVVEHHQIGALAGLERAQVVAGRSIHAPRVGVRPERLVHRQPLRRIELAAQLRAPRARRVDAGPRVVVGDRRVGRAGQRHAAIEVRPHRHHAVRPLLAERRHEALAPGRRGTGSTSAAPIWCRAISVERPRRSGSRRGARGGAATAADSPPAPPRRPRRSPPGPRRRTCACRSPSRGRGRSGRCSGSSSGSITQVPRLLGLGQRTARRCARCGRRCRRRAGA